MSWPLFSWFVVGVVTGLAEVVNVLAELVNVLAELVNARTELANVRALPISCLVPIRSGNSSPMTLIMISWFEPRNANSETPKSNLEFINSCFAFTLYRTSGGLQLVVCQQDWAACFALLITADTGLSVLCRSVAYPFISPCLSCG